MNSSDDRESAPVELNFYSAGHVLGTSLCIGGNGKINIMGETAGRG